MFQLDNQVTGERSEFDNRSSFLYAIETLEKRLLATNQSAPYVLKHLDKDGRVLESRELIIPQRDGTDSVDVLADFGFQKASKKPKQRGKDKSQMVPPKAFKGEKEVSSNRPQKGVSLVVNGLILLTLVLTLINSAGLWSLAQRHKRPERRHQWRLVTITVPMSFAVTLSVLTMPNPLTSAVLWQVVSLAKN